MQEKVLHLQFIQEVIKRMASNSFIIKGWSVTLVSALFAVSVADTDKRFILIAYIPAIMFWFLDAFFLYQERLFRMLYKQVAEDSIGSEQFTMSTTLVMNRVNPYLFVLFSKTMMLFHGTLIGCIILVMSFYDKL